MTQPIACGARWRPRRRRLEAAAATAQPGQARPKNTYYRAAWRPVIAIPGCNLADGVSARQGPGRQAGLAWRGGRFILCAMNAIPPAPRPAPSRHDTPRHDATCHDATRHDWTQAEIETLLGLPFPDLLFQAQTVHRAHHDPCRVQISTLLSIKTGGCPEDCAYCPQSAAYETGLDASKLMQLDAVIEEARAARDAGATRFCMGAAWRSPKARDLDAVCTMVEGVRALGLQSCATLGMLTKDQAGQLAAAGLDYYNHNLDTSPEHYGTIITTRVYQDRLDTLGHVRDAGIAVCCGGIVGMGERVSDRAGLIAALASLPKHPESVPINALVRVQGTPLAETAPIDALDFVRVIAAARITMPRSYVRLSAGREGMSDEAQALCFLAGANSIFYGERLLTTPNPAAHRDRLLLERLGITPA
jgi:biotin synthase